MTAYTIQSLQPSGDTFALMYDDDNQIIACYGPLYYADRDAIIANPSMLADLEYDDNDNEWLNAQEWGYSVCEWD